MALTYPMTELILHHYETSPFSEKVRLALGVKKLSWRSVVIPMVAPKPDLVPLTGGYRHTPVLQIGADIYCDTRMILREIDRRHPERPLIDARTEGLSAAIEAWAERDLFWPIARYLTGTNAEAQQGFHADRAALRGKKAPRIERVQAAARSSLPLVEAQLPLVDSMVRRSPTFLLSDQVCQADLALYHALWFLKILPIDCSSVLDPYPEVRAWMERVAALGHGSSEVLLAKDALAIAASREPEAMGSSAPLSHDPALGEQVSIRPDGYTTDDVSGELAHIGRHEIVLRRYSPEVGKIAVHFPRLGYSIRKQT